MKIKKIMIVKKSDLTGTSTKHIEIPEDMVFEDLVYMEVSPDELKRRSESYWSDMNSGIYNACPGNSV